jgi:RimJ/RimL family protein N-acetyltransferase
VDPIPVTLEGELVRLEPLAESHLETLVDVGLDPDIWDLNPRVIRTRDHLAAYIDTALAEATTGSSVPFAIVLKANGHAIGSSRFGNIDRQHRRLEIGWTWIGRNWWRTGVNTECKLLLLSHAFEDLGCARVELKTDTVNRRSRNAMLRLGATEEGTLRKHMLTETGRWRDTVYYSILDDEWPDVRAQLEAKQAEHA